MDFINSYRVSRPDLDSGDQNVLSFTMNKISLGENQITLFRVWVKKVIWVKTKTLILGENRYTSLNP